MNKELLKLSLSNMSLFFAILGISWFWMIGSMLITEMPLYVKLSLNADEKVATLLFAIFSIGIAIGSMFCNKLMKGKLNADYIPIAALFMI